MMYKKLTNDQKKIYLVARLVKDGTIDFNEALSLLEIEVITDYISYPIQYPNYPIYPPVSGMPFTTTCLYGSNEDYQPQTDNEIHCN